MLENCAVEHGTMPFICTPTVYPKKFKYLPRVTMQQQLVCNDPRARYEVAKSISLRTVDTSTMAKASDEAELTDDDILCAALAYPPDIPHSFRAEVVVSVTLHMHM